MKKNSKNEYVNNKEFYKAIVEYRNLKEQHIKEGKEPPRIPDYIGTCIYKIAEKLSLKPCFVNYSYRDEMILDGVENSFLYFHDYDPHYVGEGSVGPNPFAYFTQIIYFAFIRRIAKEEKNRYIIYKNFHEVIGHNYDQNTLVDGENNSLMSSPMYDNIYSFMDKFEKKEEVKRRKRKQNKKPATRLDNFFYEDS